MVQRITEHAGNICAQALPRWDQGYPMTRARCVDDETSSMLLRKHQQAFPCIIHPEQLLVVGSCHRLKEAATGGDIPLQADVIKVTLGVTAIARYHLERRQRHAWHAPTRQAMVDGEKATSQSLLQTCPRVHCAARWIVEPMRWLH